jgi:DNA-binding Lrp family transcriptional regulator
VAFICFAKLGVSVRTNANSITDSEARTPRLDDLDRRLIAELERDARIPFSELGAHLGVTGMTAANRLQRLRQQDLVRLRVYPVLEACDITTEILGLIQADVSAISLCIEALRASPYVLRIERVTGEYDISFSAAFPNETAMGVLVRDLQAVPGVRRIIVHHQLETLKDETGWNAVWAERSQEPPEPYELAPSANVPEELQPLLVTAAAWLKALVQGDVEQLSQLSHPAVVFTIAPPYPEAGTFDGLDEVIAESQQAAQVYRHLWHRIVGVSPASDPYAIIVDSLNTAERKKGQVRSSFARMAFAFEGGLVSRVLSMGQMDLPEIPRGDSAQAVEA